MKTHINCGARALITCIIVATTFCAHGDQILYQHIGSNDPLEENWTIYLGVKGADSGPIDDAGTPAWYTDDNSTAALSALIYQSPSDLGGAETSGWRLSIRMRVVDGSADGKGASFFELSTGSWSYIVFFGVQADDPVVYPWPNGPTTALEGIGPGYHDYSLVYDPVAQSADLFVDGVERLSDYRGLATADPRRVAWGAGAGLFTGQANYNLVEFAVLPEPGSTAVLCPIGLAVLVGLKRLVRHDRCK